MLIIKHLGVENFEIVTGMFCETMRNNIGHRRHIYIDEIERYDDRWTETRLRCQSKKILNLKIYSNIEILDNNIQDRAGRDILRYGLPERC